MSANLPTIAAADLPPLAYAHPAAHDIALTASPSSFRPVIGSGWVKPNGGSGLWTAPITRYTEAGLPADSVWLEWARLEMDFDGPSELTEIFPTAEARVLLIDSQADLVAIVDAYPAGRAFDDLRYPDWPRLAADGWDAVYLTDEGQWATRLPDSGPDLYGWDMASVLWLRHAYTVGRTATAMTVKAVAR